METVFKKSIVCAAVASLVACGGGSGGSGTPTGDTATRQVTAMDGLLYNAVIFRDNNANQQWDSGEALLGLTNQQGQATVDAGDNDVLGVVTLISGSPTSLAMAQQDDLYQGVSTIDMDFPNTPMAKEVTLVAPSTIDVISPYTHLLSVIQNQQNIDLTEAEALLSQQLDTEGLKFTLKEDYIKNGSLEQHKVAQLLTDAMAASPSKVITDWQDFVQEAAQVVNQMGEAELNNPSFRPALDGDKTTQAVNNTKLVFNPEAWDALMKQWDSIGDISTGDSGMFFTIDLNAIPIEGGTAPLYEDPDRPNQGVDYSLIHFWAHGAKQEISFDNRLDVKIEADGTTLSLSSDEIFKAERNDFFLAANDYNADGDLVFSMLSLLDINTSSVNKSPTVSANAQNDIQQLIDANWNLEKGQGFEQVLDLSQWFSDPEGDTLTYTVSGSLLDVGLSAQQDQNSIIISGVPVRSFSEENIRHSLTITASDGFNYKTAQVTVQLPEVNEGMLVDSNPLVGKSWYFIEEVEEDGVTKNYCSYVQFADGKVTQTLSDVYDFSGCGQAESQTINATSYNEVNLTTIKESVFVSTKTYTVRYQQPTDTGIAYAVSIDHFNGQDNHDVRMFYGNKSEVEQRLDIDSNPAPFEYALAIGENVEQTIVTPEVGDNYIKLAFAGDVSCDQLKDHFELNQISSNKPNVFGGSGLCLDNIDGIGADPHYILKLMGKNTFTQGEPYYVHLQYREGDSKEYGESLKLNFIKD
tara:strand:- start:352 stop:2601 length:2250 start_codon:yes stop_codon:yes gene_type:complete